MPIASRSVGLQTYPCRIPSVRPGRPEGHGEIKQPYQKSWDGRGWGTRLLFCTSKPHPAAFGDTAGSGHSALHSSALSSRALPIRLNANCRKRACSRFRGNNRPRAGFLRPHTDRFARAQRESPAIAWIQLGASCGQAAPTHLHRSPQPGSDTGRFQCPLETC
jgi:hypothetical protein